MATGAVVRQTGRRLDYTPAAAKAAGEIIEFASMIGIATEPMAASIQGSLMVEGVVQLPKKTTFSIPAGSKVYWVTASDIVTTTAGSNLAIGFSPLADSGTSATTIDVTLMPC